MINVELSMKNGVVAMGQLNNVLVEEIDDMVSIHADGGFLMNIPMSTITAQSHTETQDVYELTDGLKIIFEQNETETN